jgi:hypothetical protein
METVKNPAAKRKPSGIYIRKRENQKNNCDENKGKE